MRDDGNRNKKFKNKIERKNAIFSCASSCIHRRRRKKLCTTHYLSKILSEGNKLNDLMH